MRSASPLVLLVALLLPACDRGAPPPEAPHAPPVAGARIDAAPQKAPEQAPPTPAPDGPVKKRLPRRADDPPAVAGGGGDPPAAPAGEPVHLDFERLAGFDYMPPSPEQLTDPTERIPEEIRALDGRRATVLGHMVPLAADDETGRVTRFLLSRYLAGCCFTGEPKLNEYVLVDLPAGESVEWTNQDKVLILGVLEVGEVRDETGYVITIYRMVATEVTRAG